LRGYSFGKKFKDKQTVIREKLHKTLSYVKGARKMLMKLIPYVSHGTCTGLFSLLAAPLDVKIGKMSIETRELARYF